MKRSDSPSKQPKPFGINGQREDILPTTPSGDNSASFESGFPPITMTLKSAGGLPPKGQNMNQILYELSALSRWSSAGVINTFDASFATSVGGYAAGSLVISDDLSKLYISTVDENNNNPNSNPTGWLDALSYLGLHETGFATLTSSGSFTVPEGVTELWISGCAGGAGGGGSQTTSNATVAGSGGGSSGGFVQRFKLAVTPGQVIPYTIGAAGTGGAAGGGIGGDGGNTTFGSYLTLLGGKGGAVGQSAYDSASGGIGGLGGPTGSGGGHGSWGGDSQNINGGGAYGGKGGDCPFGSAGGQVRGNVNPIAGMDAVGYGAGGGGAGGANVNGAHTGAKGGNGAPGVLFIEW